MRRWLLLFSVVLALRTAGAGETAWFKRIELSRDPESNGQTVFTIRFTPDTSTRWDTIVFDCVYHQEFPWENIRGEKYTKVHEPVTFTYQRTDIELVAELDWYCSFRVPTDRARLVAAYGEKVFNQEAPITVPRIRIHGISDSKTVWVYELAVPGAYDAAALAAQTSAAPATPAPVQPAPGAPAP